MDCSEDEPKLNSFAASSVVVLGLSPLAGSSELVPSVNAFIGPGVVMPKLNDFFAGSSVVVANLNEAVAGSSVLVPNLNVLDASLAGEPKLMAFDGSSAEEPNLKFFKGAAVVEEVVISVVVVVSVAVLVMPNLKVFTALSEEAASDSFTELEAGMPNLNCVAAAAKGAPPKPLDPEEGNLKLNAAAAASAEEGVTLLADGRGFSQAQQRMAMGWFLTRHVSHSQREPLATAEGVAPGEAPLAEVGRGLSQAQQRVALLSFLTRHVVHSQREAVGAPLADSG